MPTLSSSFTDWADGSKCDLLGWLSFGAGSYTRAVMFQMQSGWPTLALVTMTISPSIPSISETSAHLSYPTKNFCPKGGTVGISEFDRHDCRVPGSPVKWSAHYALTFLLVSSGGSIRHGYNGLNSGVSNHVITGAYSILLLHRLGGWEQM